MSGQGVGTPLSQVTLTRGMSTADLVARVRDLIAEAEADYYDDAEIVGYLNEGKSRMFTRLDVMPRQLAIDLVDGQELYAVDEIVARFEYVGLRNRMPLTPVTSEEFGRLKLTPQGGQPRYYCPEFIAPDGRQAIAVYPTPEYTEANGIHGVYYAEPPDLFLGDPAHVPPLAPVDPVWHVPYHPLPAYYAASVLLRKDRLRDQSEHEEQRFIAGVEEYRRWYERRFPRRVRTTQERRVISLPGGETEVWPFEIGT